MTDSSKLSDAAAYEVAREILLELIAYASARLDEPDWTARMQTWQRQLATLHPADTDAVRAVLRRGPSDLAAIRNS